MLGFCSGTNTFYSVKSLSFGVTLPSFTPGQEHLKLIFLNNAISKGKYN